MDPKDHILEIYEPDGYAGPNPLRVTGVGLVRGPERTQYYLLELADPVQDHQVTIGQLAIRPHYDGDPISHAVESVCTVGIALARPGQVFQAGQSYGFADFCFWKVGKIHPANH